MNNGDNIKKCCFTGYRPSKFPFELGENSIKFIKLENKLIDVICSLQENENCNIFYSGMAMGFDIIAAENVLMLKKAYKNKDIKLYCIIPFEGQQNQFNELWQKRYMNVLSACDKVIVTSDKYFQGCYQKRNQYMVDNCDFVITWYDGKNGGTKNTINYANKLNRSVINLNDDYEDKNKISQLQMLCDI